MWHFHITGVVHTPILQDVAAAFRTYPYKRATFYRHLSTVVNSIIDAIHPAAIISPSQDYDEIYIMPHAIIIIACSWRLIVHTKFSVTRFPCQIVVVCGNSFHPYTIIHSRYSRPRIPDRRIWRGRIKIYITPCPAIQTILEQHISDASICVRCISLNSQSAAFPLAKLTGYLHHRWYNHMDIVRL